MASDTRNSPVDRENNSSEPSRPRARPVVSVWGLAEAAGLLLCAATIAGCLARVWWVFELATHFRLHLAAGLAGVTAIWLIRRRWKMSALFAACALVNGLSALATSGVVESASAPTGPHLRLISLNVHTENEQRELVLGFLQKANADVILLMEVNAGWMQALQALQTNYPTLVADPREDNFGIALFSRVALTNTEVIELGESDVPSIAATIPLGDKAVFLLGTHPLPPGSAGYARRRNDQLRAIATLIHAQSLPAIVAGDLNCTPGSPHFTDLLADSGLRNISPQRSLAGSWPAMLPWGKIPLDHGLVSSGIRVVEKHFGPFVGSDHLPLILEVQLSTPGGPAAQPIQ